MSKLAAKQTSLDSFANKKGGSKFKTELLSELVEKFDDVVLFALNDEQFTMLAHLLNVCATFRASSADCARGFILLNAIKTKSRNRMETDHLDIIMRPGE